MMNQRQNHRRRRQSAVTCGFLRPMIKFFGITTAFVVCGVGVDVYMHGYQAGFIILIFSMLMLFLETKWIVTLFLQLLFANENCSTCLECWSCMKFLGGWRLAPPYITVGVGLLMWPHNLWLSYVAGFLLVHLALLRLCTIFRFDVNSRDEELLPETNFERAESYLDISKDGCVEVFPSLEDEDPIDDVH